MRSTSSARWLGVGGMPGFGSSAPASRIPDQLMKYDMSLWYTTTGTPLSAAARVAQPSAADRQRSAKESARVLYRSALAWSSSTNRPVSTSATLAILRGSRWICGFPAGWISPSARSMTFGISSFTTYCDASRYPGDPNWMRSLPDCVSSNGSQPTSSSEPEQISRSALRMRAIKLGRASMRCGSCRAVVAEKTETLSPPSSCASAPHSGSQAKTFSAAPAGHASIAVPNARSNLRRVFMFVALEPVRAMRAEAHDVLEKELVVGLVEPRVVPRELQTNAAGLARVPVDHRRMPLRLVGFEDREIRRAQRTGIHQPDVRRARIKPVVAVAEAPLRQELVHTLQIPSRLPAGKTVGQRRARGVEREITVLGAPEVFVLQLEVVVRRIAVG